MRMAISSRSRNTAGIRLLSLREDRSRAFRDCDDFIGQIVKAVEEIARTLILSTRKAFAPARVER
jgi:hypothetical protein